MYLGDLTLTTIFLSPDSKFNQFTAMVAMTSLENDQRSAKIEILKPFSFKLACKRFSIEMHSTES